jgi:Tol biopolymer transport system component
MSPEQARGKVVDRRCDIWSFGAVLFEMLSGKQAFPGEDVSHTLAAVIMKEPDWNVLPDKLPVPVGRLLRRCLTKDPNQRLQAIGEARIAIEEALSGAAEAAAGLPSQEGSGGVKPTLPPWRRALPWVLAGLLAIAVLAPSIGFLERTPHPTPMHFSIVTNFAGVQAQPSLSPDGRSVAFVSNRDGHYNIYVGLISGGKLVQITNDPNLKSRPAWSPDGSTIAFARLNESGIWDIWQVPALGGTPRRLILNAVDPAWSPDGHSLAYENVSTGTIWVSNASGQNARQLAPPEPGLEDTEPRFSPNGRRIAFAARSGGPYGELGAADLDSGKAHLLTHDGALAVSPAWSPDSRFIYFASSRGGTINIWKMGADGSGLWQVTAGAGDDAELDVSADGKRIVFSTLRENIGLAQLDLQAKPGQSVKPLTTDPARNQFGPTYSPDGNRLAYFTNFKGAENEAIWVADADGLNAVQLVRDERGSAFPAWTPDGKYLVYTSFVPSVGKGEFRSTPISGGVPQTLTEVGWGIADVGRDGRLLFLGTKGQVETFDPADGKTRTLATLPFSSKLLPFPLRWSPDQHSIACVVLPSKENDPNAGLWVDDFKSPPRQVFRGWVLGFARGPGNEIYLLDGKPDLSAVLWKVGWNGQGPARTSASARLLYNLNYEPIPFNLFDVAPDGRRLAMQTQQVLEEHIGMIENIR